MGRARPGEYCRAWPTQQVSSAAMMVNMPPRVSSMEPRRWRQSSASTCSGVRLRSSGGRLIFGIGFWSSRLAGKALRAPLNHDRRRAGSPAAGGRQGLRVLRSRCFADWYLDLGDVGLIILSNRLRVLQVEFANRASNLISVVPDPTEQGIISLRKAPIGTSVDGTRYGRGWQFVYPNISCC